MARSDPYVGCRQAHAKGRRAPPSPPPPWSHLPGPPVLDAKIDQVRRYSIDLLRTPYGLYPYFSLLTRGPPFVSPPKSGESCAPLTTCLASSFAFRYLFVEPLASFCARQQVYYVQFTNPRRGVVYESSVY